jgi:hypothetical protein
MQCRRAAIPSGASVSMCTASGSNSSIILLTRGPGAIASRISGYVGHGNDRKPSGVIRPTS